MKGFGGGVSSASVWQERGSERREDESVVLRCQYEAVQEMAARLAPLRWTSLLLGISKVSRKHVAATWRAQNVSVAVCGRAEEEPVGRADMMDEEDEGEEDEERFVEQSAARGNRTTKESASMMQSMLANRN